MNSSKWVSGCAVGILIVATSTRAGAEEADDPFSPVVKSLQAADERSILVADRQAEPKPESSYHCSCVGEPDSAAVTRIKQALQAPLRSPGLDFTDAPLEEVVNSLQTDYGIPLQLDVSALDEIGLGPDEPVTINLHNISLRSALRLMLTSLNLTYIIRDEVLLITTQDEAESHLVTCVYDVRGLADDADPESTKSLIDAIVSCVASETWAVNGGGEAEVRPLKPGLLVVSQTQAVQEEVADLLRAIRKMRERVPITRASGREPEPAQKN